MQNSAGATLVRVRVPYVPSIEEGQPNFADPVVVVRPPYRVTFSYSGKDRIWRDTWRGEAQLPKAIRLQVRDAATSRILSSSTAMLIHAELPSDCARAASFDECFDPARKQDDTATPARGTGGNTGPGGGL